MYSETNFSTVRATFIQLVLVFVIVPGITHADSVSSTLTVKPSRCIALQQGQKCFATLKFQWTTPASGEFCLYDERQPDPIVCWVGTTIKAYKQKFESNKNVNYEIRLKMSEQPLARALVKISWIYKSNTSSTSRWRLF